MNLQVTFKNPLLKAKFFMVVRFKCSIYITWKQINDKNTLLIHRWGLRKVNNALTVDFVVCHFEMRVSGSILFSFPPYT